MNEKPFTQEQAKRVKSLILFEAPQIVIEMKDKGKNVSLEEAINTARQIASQVKEGMTKSEVLSIAEAKLESILAIPK